MDSAELLVFSYKTACVFCWIINSPELTYGPDLIKQSSKRIEVKTADDVDTPPGSKSADARPRCKTYWLT